ncbi:EthD family reductase [Marmoricola sp. RAF53]|uniref:EthD family reductase n=1 Tax=Marmoricola sp. RAF53 TaxID=3233059 RepID=UPI003F9D851B
MHRITIQYAMPENPADFDEHYFTRHVELVRPLPGLAGFSWSKPRPLGGEQTVYLVAQLDFESADDLKGALRSAEMAAAGEDAAGLGVATTMFSGEVVEGF